MEPGLEFQNVVKIGENDSGYWFGAGTLDGIWYGFAVGATGDKSKMIFLLPGCDEVDLWDLTDETEPDFRDEIIKRAGAGAQSAEHGYGGIARWFVEESLRGRPEEYLCPTCGSVGCASTSHDFDDEDFDN